MSCYPVVADQSELEFDFAEKIKQLTKWKKSTKILQKTNFNFGDSERTFKSYLQYKTLSYYLVCLGVLRKVKKAKSLEPYYSKLWPDSAMQFFYFIYDPPLTSVRMIY